MKLGNGTLDLGYVCWNLAETPRPNIERSPASFSKPQGLYSRNGKIQWRVIRDSHCWKPNGYVLFIYGVREILKMLAPSVGQPKLEVWKLQVGTERDERSDVRRRKVSMNFKVSGDVFGETETETYRGWDSY